MECCLSLYFFKFLMQEELEDWYKCSKMAIKVDVVFSDDQIITAGCDENIDYMIFNLEEEYKSWAINMSIKKYIST